MAAINRKHFMLRVGQALLLALLYIFLYFPILFITYVSFVDNIIWPFPPQWTLKWYTRLLSMSDFHAGLLNSFTIGLATAVLATLFATAAVIGLLKYRTRWRGPMILLYISPLFVPGLLIGISTLMFNANVLGLSGKLISAIVANTTEALAFSFLVILAQLVRYDWHMDEAAMVFGARPARVFWEVTLPTIWPAILGAFLVSFILAFNNLEISFYNLGAIPTLPTIAWGTLRHGIKPELFALATVINILVFSIIAGLFFLIQTGLVRFGYRGE